MERLLARTEHAPDLRVLQAFYGLTRPPGTPPYTERGLSSRQLRRLITQQVGLPPRRTARVIRFQQCLQHQLRGHIDSPWLLAFTDQAHLIHEYRALGGIRPGDLKRRAP